MSNCKVLYHCTPKNLSFKAERLPFMNDTSHQILAALTKRFLADQDHSQASDEYPLIFSTLSFFDNKPINLESLIAAHLKNDPISDEESTFTQWQTFLTLCLINHLSNSQQNELLTEKGYKLLNTPWNQQSLYLKSIIAFSQALIGMPKLDINIDPLTGGALPIAQQEYCSWSDLPFGPKHAEMALFLTFFAFLTNHEKLKQYVLKMIEWHVNMLDHDYIPIATLYTQEREGALSPHLITNYLLFKSASQLFGETQYVRIIHNQALYLEKLFKNRPFLPQPLYLLIENWLDHITEANFEKKELNFSSSIKDPSMALVGWREQNGHAICTLHGYKTGMGSFKSYDVNILNYGPQYLPLEDCQGFGIEGNFLSEKGIRKTSIQQNGNEFSIQGCVRLVDQPTYNAHHQPNRFGQLRGIWQETEQTFKKDVLSIKTNYLGFDGWNSVAFIYYVQAEKCIIGNEKVFLPRTLQVYEGESLPIILQGNKGQMQLNSDSTGKLKIIPLGGGDCFWGADFLIIYHLEQNQKRYQWDIWTNTD